MFTCIITLTQRLSRPGTGISWLHSSGTMFMPSSLAASAGKVDVRSDVVVKKIEADGSPGGTPTVTHKIVKVTIETA